MPPVFVTAALMLLSALVQMLDSVIIRYLVDDLHPLEILFFRNLFSLVAILPLLSPADLSLHANGLWPVHAARAVLKIAAMTAAFFAIGFLSLSVFTAIAFTTPLFVTLGVIIFLGERARSIRLAALALGFVGILVVLRPTDAPSGPGIPSRSPQPSASPRSPCSSSSPRAGTRPCGSSGSTF